MKPHNLRFLVIGIAMLVAAGLALELTPRERIADHGPKIDLETMIPKQFGVWKIDESVVPLMADPKQTAVLNKIYNQTLSRTYSNTKGERIMLSIAYGGDQSDSMAVHKPEVCYPSQGFQIIKQANTILETGFHSIPARHLVALQNNRVEPITYWMTIGDKVPGSGTNWKLEQLKYGLTGKVPDGLLFRVSSISTNQGHAFIEQARFIRELLKNSNLQARNRLIGSSS